MKEKAILVHEICGESPVHPKTNICMTCHTPVFPDECYKISVSEKWIKNHPDAKEYLVNKE